MKNLIAETKNLSTLAGAAQTLRARPSDLPGIAAIVGKPGVGKTQGAVWLRDRTDAVFLRAKSVWTQRALIDDLAKELRQDARGKRGVVFDRVIEALAMSGRPVIIDEADYLLDCRSLLDAVRDVHDLSQTPLFVIGMERFLARAQEHEQFASRIAQSIEFIWADLDDTRSVAETYCEVRFADDLLERIRVATGGSLRRIKVALLQVETWADRMGIELVSSADWGDQIFEGRIVGKGKTKDKKGGVA